MQSEDDLYYYGAYKDGVHYALAANKSAHPLLFAEYTENTTEPQLRGHRLWVDNSGKDT
jgi:hypothetical protein